MKKLLFITALIISSTINAQTYRSDFQIDMASTGNKKGMSEKATLVFSKEKGEFSIKFDVLKNTQKFKISYLDKVANGNEPYTIYAIASSPYTGYDALKIAKFSKPVEGENGKSYSMCFTIIAMNRYNEVGQYTAFYVE